MERDRRKKRIPAKKTKQVDGLAPTTKAKASPAWAKARQRQDKGKGKGKNKNKGKGFHHGKKRKKGFHGMEEHDDTQDTPTSQDYTEWTDTSWDHSDKWNDADWWTNDWSTDLRVDNAWVQAARQLPPSQPAQQQSNSTHGGSISMLGGKMNQMKDTRIGTTSGTIGTKVGCRTR